MRVVLPRALTMLRRRAAGLLHLALRCPAPAPSAPLGCRGVRSVADAADADAGSGRQPRSFTTRHRDGERKPVLASTAPDGVYFHSRLVGLTAQRKCVARSDAAAAAAL